MKEIISVFNASRKGNIVRKNTLDHQLRGLCETRWIEQHDNVIQFRDAPGSVAEALDDVANWRGLQSAAKARTLRIAVGHGEFIMAIVRLSSVLVQTIQLSRLCQK
ncbi:hypothetical protein HPB49_003705 [Dermacentor silvarum]|uniref:Uncharacterized protein n=1 Tax=Dermacentor silvarum TaxID=543639 RepID=A0ACB8DTW0_DERSI|nr:hypothetical protein HPB49_003705 [Dermacentor silvarum]